MPNPLAALLSRFQRTELDAEGHRVPALPAAVSAGRALELVEEGATLVDVRERSEWRTGHAPHAVHIPLGSLEAQARRISTQRPVVVMCQSGSRSRTGVHILRTAGYRATSLSGGITAWQAAGGVVRTGR